MTNGAAGPGNSNSETFDIWKKGGNIRIKREGKEERKKGQKKEQGEPEGEAFFKRGSRKRTTEKGILD